MDRPGRRPPTFLSVLQWALLEVLPKAMEDQESAALQRYLGDDAATDGPVDARAFGLATRLANLFDRYVNYRPDWAIAWSEGRSPPLGTTVDLAWQRKLWQHLDQQLEGAPHRAQRAQQASSAQRVPGGRPLRLFGVSGVPRSWIAMIAEVARVRRVELYLLAPSAL